MTSGCITIIGFNITRNAIRKDLDELGIQAKIDSLLSMNQKIVPNKFVVTFNNEEDEVLYRLSGKYKHNPITTTKIPLQP